MDYANEIAKVINAVTPKVPLNPILIYDVNGWTFNGINYGEDKEKAIQARDKFYKIYK